MTLVFENRDTVRFQIQEMLRVERIVRPDKIEAEIAVYNELLPGPGELAATLFIEVTVESEVQPTLDRFIGLDEPGKVVLRTGEAVYPALFAPGKSREDRISAVHDIRFPLGEDGRLALEDASSGGALLEVQHVGYEAQTVLSPETG